MLRSIFLMVFSIGMSGCAMTYSMEGAGERPDDDVAILVSNLSLLDPYVYVADIDGVSRRTGSFRTYRLLPGERHITLYGNSQSGF